MAVKEEERYKPSASPTNPKGDFVSIVTRLNRAIKVGEIEQRDLEEIAQLMFEIFLECDDDTVLNGKIPKNLISELNISGEKITQRDLELYLKIANSLFALANNNEISATKVLSPEVVKDFDIKTAALANVKGGRFLLALLCQVVNQENSDRVPSHSILSSSQVEGLLDQEHNKF